MARFRQLSWVLAVVAGAVAGGPAAAQQDLLEGESILDRPMEKEGWPEELTRRPLTLAPGMLQLQVPLGVNLSDGRFGKPTFLAPSLAFGVSENLTLALRHVVGVCLTGQDGGCPQAYRDVELEALGRLARGTLGEVGWALGLEASPVVDSPFALSGEARLVLRAGTPIQLAFAPSLRFGLVERDAVVNRPTPLAFPLGSFSFGWYETQDRNREYLSLPLTAAVQLSPRLAVALAAALDGPLAPEGASFWDVYRLPLGAALVVTPSRAVDVGAGFTLLNLLGRGAQTVGRWDERAAQLFLVLRT